MAYPKIRTFTSSTGLLPPNLEQINFIINNLTSFNLDGGGSITQLYLQYNSLEAIDLRPLTSSLDSIRLDNNPLLSSVIMNPTLPSVVYLNWGACALPEEVVNEVLQKLDANGISSGFCNLAGGTNAAPSGAGATAVGSLNTKSWTVFTN